MQSYFEIYDLEMTLKIFSIAKVLVDLTRLELTKGKQSVKMLRFTMKTYEINQ